MKSSNNIIFLLLSLLFVACDQNPNPKRLLEITNLSIPKDYKISDFKSDWEVGETTEDYTLLISNEDYKVISKEIERKIFFQRLDTSKVPKQAFTNDTDLKKINETACWYNNKYFYQIYRPDPGVVISVVLEKDSLMSINYIDL
jgi:hypothetical protein